MTLRKVKTHAAWEKDIEAGLRGGSGMVVAGRLR